MSRRVKGLAADRILEIDIRKRLAAVVAHDKAGF
jgi:hypothetical protein